jgi:hypothetical protein
VVVQVVAVEMQVVLRRQAHQDKVTLEVTHRVFTLEALEVALELLALLVLLIILEVLVVLELRLLFLEHLHFMRAEVEVGHP